MRILVVYESIFGNTRQIAEAVARGLESAGTVETKEVASASRDVSDYDIIVVGGPTHAFSMSRATTRLSGRAQAEEHHVEPVSKTIGIRDWIDTLDPVSGVRAAAFDTGVGKLGFLPAGSAAKKAAARLRQKGFALIAEPRQFLVSTAGGETLLKDGEEAAAEAWGAELAAALSTAPAG